jgi:hypothetical protein
LLPLITDFINVAHGTSNFWGASQVMTERILASGVVIVSGEILNSLITKILRKVS